jgi:hypothetical protein
MYAMRRANGDWFALRKLGSLHVPIFSTNEEAIQARIYNVEMLVFKPALLDQRALDDLAGVDTNASHFWLVEAGSPTLRRGQLLTYPELVGLCEH